MAEATGEVRPRAASEPSDPRRGSVLANLTSFVRTRRDSEDGPDTARRKSSSSSFFRLRSLSRKNSSITTPRPAAHVTAAASFRLSAEEIERELVEAGVHISVPRRNSFAAMPPLAPLEPVSARDGGDAPSESARATRISGGAAQLDAAVASTKAAAVAGTSEAAPRGERCAHADAMKQAECSLERALHAAHWDAVVAMLNADAALAHVTLPCGHTLLHHALQRRAPRSLVLMLLRDAPGSARHAAHDAVLPLHAAARAGCELAVVKELLDAHPAATRAPTAAGGNLPLHLAALAGAPRDTLRAVLRAHPDGAAAPNAAGLLPLHLAARAAGHEWTASTRAQQIRAEQKSGEASPFDLPPVVEVRRETPSFLQLHATHRDLLGLRADNLLPLRTA